MSPVYVLIPVIRAMLVSDRQPSRAQPSSSCAGMKKMEWHEMGRNEAERTFTQQGTLRFEAA
ncbi:hypothetical protein [Dyella sp.]|uniref:hypothetical protein n=1 Tax=Dyella sp. TaxID=1869338 RepID=UPI003F801BA0